MSDTPETDAAAGEGDLQLIVSADFARSLERRLQEAQKERDTALRDAGRWRLLCISHPELEFKEVDLALITLATKGKP